MMNSKTPKASTRREKPEKPLLRIRDLHHEYHEGKDTRSVLRNVDFEIWPGECVALLGRSGSGKSTLLNLIAGIDQPTAGTIEINGVPLTRLSEHDRTLFRRQHIGFIYQFYNLIPTLSVEENLLLPLELNGWDRNAAHDAVMTLLDQVGLKDRSMSYPDRLSGGEQQRIAIARALIHDPLLVLADEPTGTLDVEIGGQVLELFDRLLRDRKKTLFLVTHSKAVTRRADRVLTLVNGQLSDRVSEIAW